MSDPGRLRILLVTRNLPPLVGGMERLNWHMASELARQHEVRIIGPAGSAAVAPPGVTVEEVPLRPLWRFLKASLGGAAKRARAWRPDVVLAGSGLTAPAVWLAARLSGARAVVYVHGLDIALGRPLYRVLWLPAVRRADLVIANSSATRRIAVDKGIPQERIVIVHPGVDLPKSGADRASAAVSFRQRHDLGSGQILLSVGRLTARKGLREFVRDILPQVAAVHPDVQLVVVGGRAKDALAAGSQTPESILATAEWAGMGGRVHFIGIVNDQLLSEAYLAAAVHVFPIKEIPGDPEGFGMVAIEAAALGLPTVAFACGGVVDAVLDGRTGSLVEGGDTNGFAEAVNDALSKPRDEAWQKTCMEAAANFEWKRFGERINAVVDMGGSNAAR